MEVPVELTLPLKVAVPEVAGAGTVEDERTTGSKGSWATTLRSLSSVLKKGLEAGSRVRAHPLI